MKTAKTAMLVLNLLTTGRSWDAKVNNSAGKLELR
jgi:hypothetical protein